MRIEIDGWQARITFSAAHVIAGHPKCGRLHGHTYAVHAILHGDLGPDEMVFDFGIVKRALRSLADELDHKLIAPSRAVRPATKGSVEVQVGQKAYRLPRGDVAAVEIEASSAERLAQYFADRLLATVAFPPSLHEVEVGVDEGPGQGAWVRRQLPSMAERGMRPRRRP